MAKRGYIYKGLKPVYWCTDCETALAEAEIEYRDDTTNSIYVKFEVKDDKGKFKGFPGKVYFVIWTTTTWTLPGNTAISLNPHFEYSLIKTGDEIYVLATELVSSVCEAAGISDYKTVGKFLGSDLEYLVCLHPFLDRESLVITGEHVTLEVGTGCVHTAPGHGAEDYEACKGYDIPMIVPLDEKGYLNEHAGPFAGMYYEKSNQAIIEELKRSEPYWRLPRLPTLILIAGDAGSRLFIVQRSNGLLRDDFKQAAMEAISKVNWIPPGRGTNCKHGCRSKGLVHFTPAFMGVYYPIFYCELRQACY